MSKSKARPRISGKTTDGKMMLAGVFQMFDTQGLPFWASFEMCEERNMMVDWIDLYEQAMIAGWKYKTLRLRLEDALVDVWGRGFCDVVLGMLDKIDEDPGILDRLHENRESKENKMDKVDFLEVRGTFVGNFIVKAITASRQTTPDIISRINKNKHADGKDRYSLTVNGVEIPFVETVEAYEAYLDEWILEKAKELIEERVGDMVGILDEALTEAQNRMKDELTKG